MAKNYSSPPEHSESKLFQKEMNEEKVTAAHDRYGISPPTKSCPWPNTIFLLSNYSTRTYLEVTVGNSWSLPVIVFLRRQDIPWFHSDLAFHENQICQLIRDYVIAAEFPALLYRSSTAYNNTASNPHPNQIKATDSDMKCKTKVNNNNNNSNNSEVIVGINNLKQLQQKKIQELKSSSARGKKKGKINQQPKKASVTVSSGGNNSCDPRSKIADNDDDNDNNNNNNKRVGDSYKPDVTILFGETLQITYRMEETPTGSLTLLYNNATSTSSDDLDITTREKKKMKRKQRHTVTTDVSFRALKALPKRLVLWCYPFDQNSPTKPNPQDSGFPRPEMIPLTSLFQPPKT